MALSDTFQPFTFYFEIPQASHFRLQFPPFMDAATGLPFDFPGDSAGAWTGRMDVRTVDGAVVASFATSGATGTMALSSQGIVSVEMTAANTATLTETTDFTGTAVGGQLVADLQLTDPADGEPWRWGNGRGRIRKQVTG